MAKLDFGLVVKIMMVTYALLYIFSLLGVIDLVVGTIIGYFPDVTIPPVGDISLPTVASMIALLIVGFGLTLASTAIAMGLDDPKLWQPFLVMSIVTVALWILLPQVLPGLLKPAAESTQMAVMSVFGG